MSALPVEKVNRLIDDLGGAQLAAAKGRHAERLGAIDLARSLLIEARGLLLRAEASRPLCAWCGIPMESLRRITCSDRCRVARSRAVSGVER